MDNKSQVQKILRCIEKIQTYCLGKSYKDFAHDSQLTEACVFNLGQIGEYVNRLDDDFMEAHTEIPWYQIRGLRNRIIHDYEGVNLILVWDVIQEDLPVLHQQLEQL